MKISNHGGPGFDLADSAMEAAVAIAVLATLYGALTYEFMR